MDDHDDMDHPRCRDVVSARLDGEAGADDVADAEAHLADCSACRAHAEAATWVTRLARRSRITVVPGGADAVADAVLGVSAPIPGSCGCAATCSCGCQRGQPCGCGALCA